MENGHSGQGGVATAIPPTVTMDEPPINGVAKGLQPSQLYMGKGRQMNGGMEQPHKQGGGRISDYNHIVVQPLPSVLASLDHSIPPGPSGAQYKMVQQTNSQPTLANQSVGIAQPSAGLTRINTNTQVPTFTNAPPPVPSNDNPLPNEEPNFIIDGVGVDRNTIIESVAKRINVPTMENVKEVRQLVEVKENVNTPAKVVQNTNVQQQTQMNGQPQTNGTHSNQQSNMPSAYTTMLNPLPPAATPVAKPIVDYSQQSRVETGNQTLNLQQKTSTNMPVVQQPTSTQVPKAAIVQNVQPVKNMQTSTTTVSQPVVLEKRSVPSVEQQPKNVFSNGVQGHAINNTANVPALSVASQHIAKPSMQHVQSQVQQPIQQPIQHQVQQSVQPTVQLNITTSPVPDVANPGYVIWYENGQRYTAKIMNQDANQQQVSPPVQIHQSSVVREMEVPVNNITAAEYPILAPRSEGRGYYMKLYNIPDYSVFSNGDRAVIEARLNTKLHGLRQVLPQLELKNFHPDMTLEERHLQLCEYARYVNAHSNLDTYQLVLLMLWVGMQWFCSKILGFDASNFIQFEMSFRGQYKEWLKEFNDSTPGGFMSNWNPLARILFTVFLHLLGFVVITYVLGKIPLGNTFASNVTDFISYIISGRQDPGERGPVTVQHMTDGEVQGAKLPDGPEIGTVESRLDQGFMGMSFGDIAGKVAGVVNNMPAGISPFGGIPQQAAPSRRAFRR